MKKEKDKLTNKLRQSPINYFSDLFIVAMVVLWIVDSVYESLVATVVTISSIVLSLRTGTNYFDTSMWASIGSNVAIPLSCGGAIWMIKNSIQHTISYQQGKRAHEDFPAAHPEGENEKIEIEQSAFSNIEEG